MTKFRSLVCALSVCVLVAVAYGGATKIRSFATFNEPADADGMAILNRADSQGLVVQLILTGFSPNTSYVPALFDGINEMNSFGELVTDDNGHANWHANVPTLYPWDNIRLYHCEGMSCELRAQGNP